MGREGTGRGTGDGERRNWERDRRWEEKELGGDRRWGEKELGEGQEIRTEQRVGIERAERGTGYRERKD